MRGLEVSGRVEEGVGVAETGNVPVRFGRDDTDWSLPHGDVATAVPLPSGLAPAETGTARRNG